MKKIFTLAFGLLMTVALFAADRRPQVLLNSSRNFQVVIDNRTIQTNGNTIMLNHLYNGRHTIKVYEMKRSFFGVQRRLVSQSAFHVKNNDMLIRIGVNGQIKIKTRSGSYIGYGSGKDGRDFRDDRDRRFDNDDRKFDGRRDDNDWDDDDERDWRSGLNK